MSQFWLMSAYTLKPFIMFLKANVIFKLSHNCFVLKQLKGYGASFPHYFLRWNHNQVDNNVRLYSINNLEEIKFDNTMDNIKWCEVILDIVKAKEKGQKLPSFINENHIKELLESESLTQRLKFLNFLFKKEMKKISNEKKLLKRKEKVNTIRDETSEHIEYSLANNSLLLACRKKSFIKFYDLKLSNAVLFGQKIVFDLSYDHLMRKKERRDCASQLRLVYSVNRRLNDPFDLHLCNANPESFCLKYLYHQIPCMEDSLTTITKKSYLDTFPRENLVYLSPHATETLKEYDPKAIYIIGAFVDSSQNDPVSNKKAENEGIKTYALPLNEYVLWGMGSKNLTINQVFEIMVTLRNTRDWIHAFSHIPTRKLKRVYLEDAENIQHKLFCSRNQ